MKTASAFLSASRRGNRAATCPVFLRIALALGAIVSAVALQAQTGLRARLTEHRMIWNEAPHNAFTDLAYFRGKWFCVFREGSGHVSPDGVIRVLFTDNGHWWEPAARIKMEGLDLRDPKITVTPDGKSLYLTAAATRREGNQPATMTQTVIARSRDGWEWEKVNLIGAPNYWLWRVTWHRKRAYGVAYAVGPDVRESGDYHSMLFTSRDGAEYEVAIPDFQSGRSPRPTEATLRFDAAGNMLCLHRRDGGERPTALLGFSEPPYEEWEWKDLGVYFGGPNFIQIPSGQWIACGRMNDVGGKKGPRTVVCELDLDAGHLEPLLILPSGGDNSYPGMIWHQGQVWISYYSSHEGKAAIYFAKVKLDSPAR